MSKRDALNAIAPFIDWDKISDQSIYDFIGEFKRAAYRESRK